MKLSELRNAMRKKGLDLSILCNLGFLRKDPNVFYLTQKDADFACLLIFKKKKPWLVCPKGTGAKNFKTVIIPKKRKLFEFIAEKLKGQRINTVGLNKGFLTVNEFSAIKKQLRKRKIKDISKELANLREIKTKEEIALIRKSCKITAEILQNAIKNVKRFKRDSDLINHLISEANQRNCEIAFPPVVTQNFKDIHPKALNRRLTKGFLIIDFGVRYRGYCSDMTRTIYLGKPSKKDREVYNLLEKIQRELIVKAKAGKRISELAKEAEAGLGKYKKYFSHSLGHGVGLEIHESPNIRVDSKQRFNSGVVVTIEPGVYFGSTGVRIEDTVLVTDEGAEILTRS